MEIDIEIKTQYGNDRVYVLDPAVEKALNALTGTKTLTPQHMEALMTLGFTFHVCGSGGGDYFRRWV
jgi:hypothetical protein